MRPFLLVFLKLEIVADSLELKLAVKVLEHQVRGPWQEVASVVESKSELERHLEEKKPHALGVTRKEKKENLESLLKRLE